MIYYVLFAHWLNDFVVQNYAFPSLEIGKNKSKNQAILALHIFLYTFGMWLMLVPFMGSIAFPYAVVNGVSHWAIDAATSRATSWAYGEQDFKLFWTIIGLDQFLHVAILCATLPS